MEETRSKCASLTPQCCHLPHADLPRLAFLFPGDRERCLLHHVLSN